MTLERSPQDHPNHVFVIHDKDARLLRLHRLRSLTFSKTVFVVILLCTLAGTVVGYLRALRQPFVFRVWTSVLLGALWAAVPAWLLYRQRR